MAFVTGEVIEKQTDHFAFTVVIKMGDETHEWGVVSVDEGEAQIVEALSGLRELAQQNSCA